MPSLRAHNSVATLVVIYIYIYISFLDKIKNEDMTNHNKKETDIIIIIDGVKFKL